MRTALAKSADIRELVTGLTDTLPFPERLRELIGTFRASADSYKSAQYKEMALRSDFLNPLLEELGWDPLNKRGSLYSEREVIQALRERGCSGLSASESG